MADNNNNSNSDDDIISQALSEASQKVEAKVQEAINAHVGSTEFSSSKHGLDFLQVKNSLLLTYLIELTFDLRRRLKKGDESEPSLRRLTVMKHALDKSRSLERKLRYQIDKLMAAGTTASSFVAAEEQQQQPKGEDDPLQYRPDTSALLEEDEEEDDDNDNSNDEDGDNNSDSSGDDEEVDADLEAARATVAAFKSGKSKKKSSANDDDNDDNNDDGIYRAPRISAVPYNLDKTDREEERQKRKLQRMRTSELAQALRSQYGEAPEQDDIHGGTEMGQQRESSRRFAEQQAAKTRYEEDAMVRLTTTRKEKKERKQMMRQESSNLSAIADLGNIVRDSARYEQDERRRKKSRRSDDGPDMPPMDYDAPHHSKKRSKNLQAKNSLQATLFGGDGGSQRKKKARKGRK